MIQLTDSQVIFIINSMKYSEGIKLGLIDIILHGSSMYRAEKTHKTSINTIHRQVKKARDLLETMTEMVNL